MQHVVDRARHVDELRDVAPDHPEPVALEQVLDVGGRAGQEVVDADDLVAVVEQPFAQVGSQEPGPARDDRASHAS